MLQMHKQFTIAIAAAVLGAASLASQAHTEAPRVSQECKNARLSAWFERQRQLTEGDGDPAVKLPEPAECAAMTAANDKRERDAAVERMARGAPDRRDER